MSYVRRDRRLGTDRIDRRTRLGRFLAGRERDMLDRLGGPEGLSPDTRDALESAKAVLVEVTHLRGLVGARPLTFEQSCQLRAAERRWEALQAKLGLSTPRQAGAERLRAHFARGRRP